MFGFQSSSAAETSTTVEMLLKALTDQQVAKDFLSSVDTKVAEFTKIRDDAMASLKEAEKKEADAQAAFAEAKRVASVNDAVGASLNQSMTALQARVADITVRETALNDAAAKQQADFNNQRNKLFSDLAAFEGEKATNSKTYQATKAAFESSVERTNADIQSKLDRAATLEAKAIADARGAAELKALWESKVASINDMFLAASKTK